MHSQPGQPAQKIICEKNEKLQCGPMSNVMAAQPNIGGALCESPVIPFLVPRCKVWLTPADGVPCSNATNIGECKTWKQSEFARGKFPSGSSSSKNVYIQLCNSPGDGQTSRKVWLASVERHRCTAAVTKPRCKSR